MLTEEQKARHREHCRKYRERYPDRVKQSARIFDEKHPTVRDQNARRWSSKNKERLRAHQVVKRALDADRIRREPCFECGDPRVDAHHPDYTKPLLIQWLCRQHHKDEHARLGT